ncbi:tetratricopeptide repeat protein [Chitinophagaceae bacterium MMS25-I14]
MNFFRTYMLLAGSLFIFSCNNTGQKKTGTAVADDPVFQLPAVKDATAKIESDPKNASLYFDRGNIFHKLKQDTFAIRDFQQAAKLDSTKAEYFSAVGSLMFDHKDISGSKVWLQKAIALNPQDPRAHLKFAKLLFFVKDYPGAFGQINTVLRSDVYNPEAYFLKGRIYQDMKDTNKAISSYQTALQVAPDYRDAMIQLGMVYSDRKDPIALKYLDNAFRADTSDVFPLFAKGKFYQDRNDYATAKEMYRECVTRDHQYSDAMFNMGFMLMQQDSFQAAWRQFDLVSKITPNDPDAYYNRAVCNEHLGKKDQAISDYKLALSFDPNYKDAADALKKLGVQ